MSNRRISLGKLKNLKSSSFQSDYDDDEERVKTLITEAGKRATIKGNVERPTIIPQDRADFDQQIRWKKEGEELITAAKLATYQIGFLLEELQNRRDAPDAADAYFRYFELGKELLTGIDNNDPMLIIGPLNTWNQDVKNYSIINELISDNVYRSSRQEAPIDAVSKFGMKTDTFDNDQDFQDFQDYLKNEMNEQEQQEEENDDSDDEDDDEEDDDDDNREGKQSIRLY